MPKRVNRYPGIHKRKGSSSYTAELRWTDTNGKPQQRRVGGFKTQAEAYKYKVDFLSDMNQGRIKGTKAPTLSKYLTETWLPKRTDDVKPTTLDTYKVNITAYILPHLGQYRLDQLTPMVLEDFYKKLQKDGGTGARKKVSRPLSSKSVNNVAGVLHKALRDAVRWNILAHNPSAAAIKPSKTSKEMKFWRPKELRAFIDGSKSERLHAVYALAAVTGMRRGEILGLTWDKVFLDQGLIQIDTTVVVSNGRVLSQTPKSEASIRTIDIDSLTIEALRKWKIQQNREKLLVGSGWQNHAGHLVTDELGRLVRPDRFTNGFRRVVKSLGLQAIRFHDVRHSYVVAARLAGVPLEVISRRIGHADVTVTMRVYNHTLDTEMKDAAVLAADFIRSS